MLYTVFCDESCHLQNDSSPVMVLGAMYCPDEKKKQIYSDIRAIKEKHNLNSHFEIKWTKVSKSKIEFYLEVLDYFLKNDDLHYRGLIAMGKDRLNHAKYNEGDYNLWYYKMYFRTLDPIIQQENEYHILVDIKDTKGGKRIRKLKEVMCNNIYDFNGEIITHIGQINSKESEILQLADLLNGALTYHYRNLENETMANRGKIEFIKALRKRQNIDSQTSRYESKFNLFIWEARK
jgi:hypothetical protein